MFQSRKNSIIAGVIIGVAAAVALSWAFALNGGSSGAAGGNWASVSLFPVVMGIFGAIFAFIQVYVLHGLKQLSSQMARMDVRLTNQISELGARMNERFVLMENRFTQLENRMDNRFAQMEERFTQLESRVDNRISGLESRLDIIQQNYVDDMKYRLREE